jgi:hypothetical protein
MNKTQVDVSSIIVRWAEQAALKSWPFWPTCYCAVGLTT